ncbi:MAG: cob(I)yrinic acid a,c-diamide adenosyltransferase [Hyphomicrobiaceae bacterium]|nr:MAG: cob(I)yrinic acid a,c-diamide adenosyltransferase [Hyphomicrobiaceae bacterium]
MVKLNKIYTRTGDDGTTGLVTGERVSKASRRIAATGAVDETNAAIGLARETTRGEHALVDAMLARIQNDLFDLGADIATPHGDKLGFDPLRIIDQQVDRLEAEIDAMNAEMTALTSFILPGGSPAAAALHLARAICRRAETALVALADETTSVNPLARQYINRLSDHLFVSARYVNDKGKADILWVPGKNR